MRLQRDRSGRISRRLKTGASLVLSLAFCQACNARSSLAASAHDVLPGSRPNALGAYAALGDDSVSLFYNPACLSSVKTSDWSVGMGRWLQPDVPLNSFSAAYAQPFPAIPGAVIGTGWFGLRQGAEVGKDVFLLSWAQGLPYDFLPKDLAGGASLRVIRLKSGSLSKTAAGLDGGLLWTPAPRTRIGVSVTDLDSKLPVPKPFYHLGVARDLGKVTLAGDMRMRRGLSVFYPAVELHLIQGLLDVRLGKGTSLGNMSQAALGAGLNLNPLVVNFAVTLPWKGLSRQAGSFQAEVSYRFGLESFTVRYLGKASDAASRIREEMEILRRQRRELERQMDDVSAAKAVAEQELRDLTFRLEEERIRVKAVAPAASHPEPQIPPPVPGPLAPERPQKAVAPEQWPKKHKVLPGDTLRSLAAEYYGDPGLWEGIFEANQGKILRGLPEPGEELVIPAPPKK